ncbi:YbbR-like domain-containing protein [Fructilactobacillus carniphilus]|uniref:CdaR family protein n=1 Tax=Fructilactobacillus carniphilus TaxID=2940297 RepID=A0ABY5BUZ4_9LACO|nr:CdaR family protein [Fructilactobacillus carniphilus]USS90041.1 CdaR family protein [Fructilactobacillus carniphilus]
MHRFVDSKAFALLFSLVIAVGLFFIVNQAKLGTPNARNNQANQQLSSDTRKQIEVPLQLNVNSEKYFVVGYPNQVQVQLKGPSALVTTTANTRNFKVIADLNDLGPGKHTVRLQQTGLNSQLQATIKPAKITVNIQPRETKTLPVTVEYDKNQIMDGYKVNRVDQDLKKVSITGPENEMERIDKVVAKVNLPDDVHKSTDKAAVIDAVDAKGKTVNVVISPSTTDVKLNVQKENQKNNEENK